MARDKTKTEKKKEKKGEYPDLDKLGLSVKAADLTAEQIALIMEDLLNQKVFESFDDIGENPDEYKQKIRSIFYELVAKYVKSKKESE